MARYPRRSSLDLVIEKIAVCNLTAPRSASVALEFDRLTPGIQKDTVGYPK